MFNVKDLVWNREPLDYKIEEDKIEIITKPFTDLWQRTYYHFINDNAPVLQMEQVRSIFLLRLKQVLKVNIDLINAE